jgi:hypothetical protein|tara:strand:+ start:320 stop:751 length:432 start_codon:yes stop_codon:yes gene_type:complete
METYKKIPILENYEIDTLGNVRNIKTKRILKDRADGDDYRQINLRLNKKPVTYLIHRLVAITHISNLHNFKFVDHIDRNRTNNKVSNLRWVDSKANLENRKFLKDKCYIVFDKDNFKVKNSLDSMTYTYNNLSEAVNKFKSLI